MSNVGEEVNLCSNCSLEFPASVLYCTQCGTQVVKKKATNIEVHAEQQKPSESFDAERVLTGNIPVKGKKGEVQVPTWDSFTRVVQGVKEQGLTIDHVNQKVFLLEEEIRNLSLTIPKLATSINQLDSQIEARFQQVIGQLSLLNMTMKNQLEDVLTSVSSTGRFVRELAPNLSGQFENIEGELQRIAEKQSSLGAELDKVREKLSYVEKTRGV